MGPSRRQQPAQAVTRTVAAVLAVLGVVLMWMALNQDSVSTSARQGAEEPAVPSAHREEVKTRSGRITTAPPSTATHPARSAEKGIRDQITGLVLPESKPLALQIPSLGVSSKLLDLGLDKEGALEVPRDPSLAGWFSRGAAPGALGPAVIAGHVTWNGAPAVFYRLNRLRPGERVSVSRKDGRVAVFEVTRVERFPKSKFPSRSVYGAVDHAGLRLITCGGSYDAAHHRYLDNVVVFAKLETVRRARR